MCNILLWVSAAPAHRLNGNHALAAARAHTHTHITISLFLARLVGTRKRYWGGQQYPHDSFDTHTHVRDRMLLFDAFSTHVRFYGTTPVPECMCECFL